MQRWVLWRRLWLVFVRLNTQPWKGSGRTSSGSSGKYFTLCSIQILINHARRSKELAEQWNVFVSDTFLIFCWYSSPIALAATSLAVYAFLYSQLTPSIAFTAIGVFRSLELTLGIIPELTTN